MSIFLFLCQKGWTWSLDLGMSRRKICHCPIAYCSCVVIDFSPVTPFSRTGGSNLECFFSRNFPPSHTPSGLYCKTFYGSIFCCLPLSVTSTLVDKAGAYQSGSPYSNGWLPALLPNILPGWKILTVANTLAYWIRFTVVKSFMAQATGFS